MSDSARDRLLLLDSGTIAARTVTGRNGQRASRAALRAFAIFARTELDTARERLESYVSNPDAAVANDAEMRAVGALLGWCADDCSADCGDLRTKTD